MTILPNQSILDVVLTRYGSLDAAMAFCLSNGISISDLPAAGTQYDSPVLKGNVSAARYLHSRNVVIGTAGNGVCGLVTGVAVTDITATTIMASFVAGEGAIALEWAVSTVVPEAGALIDAAVTSLLVEGLTPATATKFWIRTVCNDSLSEWTALAFITAEHSYTMQMVLRPVKMHVTKDPDGMFLYVLNYAPDAGFEHLYDLLEDWQEPTHLLRHTKEQIDTTGSLHPMEPIGLTPASGNMASKSAQFKPHSITLPGTTFVWNGDGMDLPNCLFPRFIDVEGNRAACAPVLVFDSIGGSFHCMQGTMTFGAGFMLGSNYIQPITIGHEGDNPFFVIHYIKLLKWVDDHYVSIAEPTVGATTLAVLGPGRHELLLGVTYRSVDAIETIPSSFNGAVLDIVVP